MQATLTAPERPRADDESRQALAVLVVVAVGLLLGWLLMMSIENRSVSFRSADGTISLSYPTTWLTSKVDDGMLLNVADPVTAGALRPSLKVYVRPLAQGQRLMDAATTWTLGRMSALREFRDLGTETTTVNGQSALRVSYAYVADPPAGLGPASLPIVVQASDTIVVQGNQFVVFSAAGDASQDKDASALANVLASVKLAGK